MSPQTKEEDHQFERCIQRTNEGNVAHTGALTIVYTQNNCR